MSRGPEFFIIRRGVRGALHAAVNLGSREGTGGRFLTACNQRIRHQDVTPWRARDAIATWEHDEARRCLKCSAKVG